MARGWESKSVEAQQDAALERSAKGPAAAHPDPVRSTARATLMLARNKALSDLQHACAPAHRAMLERAIADLDARIAAIEGAK
jgi:hypothetical protein